MIKGSLEHQGETERTWWTRTCWKQYTFLEFSKLCLMVDAKIIILINAAINVHRGNI